MRHRMRSDTMSQPMTLTQWYARRAAGAAHPSLTALPAMRPAGRAAPVASPPAATPVLPTPEPGALASARAGSSWGWAEPVAPPQSAPAAAAATRTELPMARDLLAAMARAAAAAG